MEAEFEVVFARRAVKQVEVARRWWRAERPEAPDRVDDELAALVARLARQPRLGTALTGTGVRRVTLATTRYAVYYRVRPRARRCEIIDVVHASRIA
ncbi:MAG: type II toxin-antitoxin system RelE/ParE family toxin [Myxococcales bacterium]|nr:type II toxin-antitoxin system RelE/ParE family toxin [Myxococcales bacterium]